MKLSRKILVVTGLGSAAAAADILIAEILLWARYRLRICYLCCLTGSEDSLGSRLFCHLHNIDVQGPSLEATEAELRLVPKFVLFQPKRIEGMMSLQVG